MLALTLWQPWASALVDGPKNVENRPWRPPVGAIGPWILIHASKTWDTERARAVIGLWRKMEPGTLPNDAPSPDSFPMGAIIGAIRFAGAIEMLNQTPMEAGGRPGLMQRMPMVVRSGSPFRSARDAIEEIMHEARADRAPWWMRDQTGWVRDVSAPFANPIHCRGLQKLWTPSADVLALCQDEIDRLENENREVDEADRHETEAAE